MSKWCQKGDANWSTYRLSRIKRSSRPALRSSICFNWLRWARTSPDFLCNKHSSVTTGPVPLMTSHVPTWWLVEGRQVPYCSPLLNQDLHQALSFLMDPGTGSPCPAGHHLLNCIKIFNTATRCILTPWLIMGQTLTESAKLWYIPLQNYMPR